MNKAFEKILDRLEELRKTYDEMAFIEMNTNGHTLDFEYAKGKKDVMFDVKQIVQEVTEEYNNGWIPCSVRLPEPNQKVIVTYMDRYIGGSYGVCEGQYVYILNSWDISDYMSDDDFEVIAWRPLPKPFKEEKNE